MDGRLGHGVGVGVQGCASRCKSPGQDRSPHTPQQPSPPPTLPRSLQIRQIDCVTVKGSTQPLGLFTYDIDLEAVPEPSDREVELGEWGEQGECAVRGATAAQGPRTLFPVRDLLWDLFIAATATRNLITADLAPSFWCCLPPITSTSAPPRLPSSPPPPGDDSCVEELLWRSHCCANPWAECPELTSCWGIDADFREDFNLGFQVGGGRGVVLMHVNLDPQTHIGQRPLRKCFLRAPHRR